MNRVDLSYEMLSALFEYTADGIVMRKVARAVEVERRLDVAQKAGKRQAVRIQANREARAAA